MSGAAGVVKIDPMSIQARAEELISYERLQAEVERLSRSEFVQCSVVGQTLAGRQIYLLAISTPENLAKAAQHRAAAARVRADLVRYPALARPAVEETVIPQGVPDWVPSVLIHCGAFAFEAAHVEAGLRFAEELIRCQFPGADQVLKEFIVLVLPMINPDGRALAMEQWRRFPLCAGFDGGGNGGGFYLNRDFNRLSQPEPNAAHRVYNEWQPLAAFDPHEDMCLLGVTHPGKVCWAPPFLKPHHPDVAPAVLDFVDRFGTAVAEEWRKQKFEVLHDRQNGALLDLVMLDGRFDLHLDLHETPTLITESARTPGLQTWEDRVAQKVIAGRVFVNCCVQWKQELFAAQHRLWLEQTRRGHADPPVAIIIPQEPPEQADAALAAELVRIIQRHRIQVYVSERPYRSWVVPLGQPDRPVIRAMLLAGKWNFYALPPAFGVTTYALTSLPAKVQDEFRQAPLEMCSTESLAHQQRTAKAGDVWQIDNNVYGVALVNELLRNGAEVYWNTGSEQPADHGTFTATSIPAGFVAGDGKAEVIHLVQGDGKAHGARLAPCHVALFSDQGVDEIHRVYWADSNYALGALNFDFERVTAKDIREGQLLRYDALLVPGGDADQILHGWRTSDMFNHQPWQQPGVSEGIGDRGVSRIREFIEQGGTYVGIGAGGGVLAAQEYAGLADVSIAAHSLGQARVLLQIHNHPLTTAMKPYRGEDGVLHAGIVPAAYHSDMVIVTHGGPLFTVGPTAESVAEYFDVDDEPWTGNIRGDYGVFRAGHSAIVHQRLGRGHIVLYGINPDFRATWLRTYVLLSNALFLARLP